MWYRRVFRFTLLICVVVLTASLVLPASAQRRDRRGRKYKAPAPATNLSILVLRRDDSKPIRNAAVIIHLLGDKGNMELKSNEDGESVIDVLPTGSHILLQIIAKGYQTYGGEYMLDKPTKSIVIRLNRPGQQYSIYDNHDQASNSQAKPGESKPADKAKNEDKSGSKDKSSDSSKPKDSQSGSGEAQQ